MKTRQQELELLAEWLGIEVWKHESNDGLYISKPLRRWNPLTNDTDFLNMVADKEVRFTWYDDLQEVVAEVEYGGYHFCDSQSYENQSKLAAMKHAAYQVCLMAAREWKGE